MNPERLKLRCGRCSQPAIHVCHHCGIPLCGREPKSLHGSVKALRKELETRGECCVARLYDDAFPSFLPVVDTKFLFWTFPGRPAGPLVAIHCLDCASSHHGGVAEYIPLLVGVD